MNVTQSLLTIALLIALSAFFSTAEISLAASRRLRLHQRLRGEQLKNSLVGAALYPAIVTCFAFVVVMVLMSYVVPQVAEVFSGTKHALPKATVATMTMPSSRRKRFWCSWRISGGRPAW